MMPRIYIGVDGGLDGGLVAIAESTGEILEAHTFPKHKIAGRRAINPCGLNRIIAESHILSTHEAWVGIEDVPDHMQSLNTMRSYATTFGILYSILCLNFGEKNVHPIKCGTRNDGWQKILLGNFKEGETKPRAAALAAELWPDYVFPRLNSKSEDSHDGLIDAALIAHFGRTKHNKQ
jgi:hypothetical protein